VKTILLALAVVLSASTAEAFPWSSSALPDSSFGLSVSAGALGAGSSSGQVSGSLNADLSFGGGSLTIAPGMSGSFVVSDFTITGLLLGQLEIKNFVFQVSNWSSVVVPGPSPYTVDLIGSTISVVQGQIRLGGSPLFDFGAAPLLIVAPAGSNTTLANNGASIDWTIPFTTLSTLSTLGIPVNITISTNLHLGVPEPASALLLAAGLAGLALSGRRKAA
jgi:hypothetical protein